MEIRVGDLKYSWLENWAKIPDMTGWAHHGLVINKAGQIVTGHANEPKILILSKTGELIREFEVPVTETHGLCISEENGTEVLWIADVGSKYETESLAPPNVTKVDFRGNVLAKITAENLNYGSQETFCPTTVAIDPNNSNVWITDGYGSSRIHILDSSLNKIKTISGSHQVGLFNCPHWVYADTRKGITEMYVADRTNNRIQIFNAKGEFLRAITENLTTPSVFSSFGEYMVVGELNARLVILDKNDAIIGTIGDGTELLSKEGWPNRKQGDQKISPLNDIPTGKFNSPHGMAADSDGNIYVSEWLIGDRFTKLELVN